MFPIEWLAFCKKLFSLNSLQILSMKEPNSKKICSMTLNRPINNLPTIVWRYNWEKYENKSNIQFLKNKQQDFLIFRHWVRSNIEPPDHSRQEKYRHASHRQQDPCSQFYRFAGNSFLYLSMYLRIYIYSLSSSALHWIDSIFILLFIWMDHYVAIVAYLKDLFVWSPSKLCTVAVSL